MGDQGAAEEVRAAGTVLWEPTEIGVQVALVHRPKYDDWSFPKGKLDPGEHPLMAAVREVAEETALRITLGRRLPPVRYAHGGLPKRVDYWVATTASTLSAFAPGTEIDEVAWLAPKAAATRLSYEQDVQTLAEFKAGPKQTVPLIVIRHASAGSKAQWQKSDASRPLDGRGASEALALADLLRCFGAAARVVSAPAERCVATVRPYAESIGAVVEIEAAFGVGLNGSANPDPAVAAARLAADSRPVVICGHRENLPALLDAAYAALDAQVSLGKPLRKAEFAVLHRAEGKLAALERYHPDGDALVMPVRSWLPELVSSRRP